MKTILFLLPTAMTIRNFIFTGILDKVMTLDDVRVVAVTYAPEVLKKYFQSNEKLFIEDLPDCNIPGESRSTRYNINNFLHAILRRRFYKIYETNTHKLLVSRGECSRLVRMIEVILCQPLPRNRTIYRCLLAIADQLYKPKSWARKLLTRFKPCLVVSTHPISMDGYDLLKHAKDSGIPSVGVIKSWDNLTGKGYIPVPMDSYVVWNDVTKEELFKLHHVPGDQVEVAGIPQFDLYAGGVSVISREKFLSKRNLDPGKKIVLYATSPPFINTEDPEILKPLIFSLNQCRPGEIQILVRIHPLDSLERYKEINAPNLVFDCPGGDMGSSAGDRLLDQDFILELHATLYYADVVVNTFSTMLLDAIAMDKPVVNISFDLERKRYYQSVIRFCEFDHLQPIVKSGATKIAADFDQLVSMILTYLDSPQLDSLQRKELSDRLCYKVDGQSSQRIADYLLRHVKD